MGRSGSARDWSRAGGSCAAPLSAGALAVLAPRPAAGPALAFLQLLLGAPNAALSGGLLLGILDPADELVAGQGRDVLPGIKCRRVGDQRLTQVRGKLMHHPAGHSLAAHGSMVASHPRPRHPGHSATSRPAAPGQKPRGAPAGGRLGLRARSADCSGPSPAAGQPRARAAAAGRTGSRAGRGRTPLNWCLLASTWGRAWGIRRVEGTPALPSTGATIVLPWAAQTAAAAGRSVRAAASCSDRRHPDARRARRLARDRRDGLRLQRARKRGTGVRHRLGPERSDVAAAVEWRNGVHADRGLARGVAVPERRAGEALPGPADLHRRRIGADHRPHAEPRRRGIAASTNSRSRTAATRT